MDKTVYHAYLRILKAELLPACGCTEPIAIAYAAALAKKTLGALPEQVQVSVSGNLIKNAKSAVVPGTDGLKGIEAATAAGLIAGEPDKKLEVILTITQEQRKAIRAYLTQGHITVKHMESPETLDIIILAQAAGHTVKLRIAQSHTNVVLLEKDGEIVQQATLTNSLEHAALTEDKKKLCVKDIIEFADTLQIADVQEVLQKQIDCNQAISQEGLNHFYGANVGKVLELRGDAVRERAKAAAAAGSDARMAGCEMPVVINSGSGNQGITITMPILVYAKEYGIAQERIYRALALANLLGLYEKFCIGTLSAYCGAVSAGCAAAAGIAYMCGGGISAVAHTLVNGLAAASGIVCDGAKPSCAAKIALGVESGLIGYEMYLREQEFVNGDGLVKKGADATVKAIGQMGRIGMQETDAEILRIMMA